MPGEVRSRGTSVSLQGHAFDDLTSSHSQFLEILLRSSTVGWGLSFICGHEGHTLVVRHN